MNATVEITETSIITFHIDNVNSLEEAEQIAQERFDDGDEPDDIEVLDVEIEGFEREE